MVTTIHSDLMNNMNPLACGLELLSLKDLYEFLGTFHNPDLWRVSMVEKMILMSLASEEKFLHISRMKDDLPLHDTIALGIQLL